MLKCEALRWLIIDEVENVGAESLAILELHVRNAAIPAHYKTRVTDSSRRSAEQSAADLVAGSRDGKRLHGVSSSDRGPKRAKTKTAKAPRSVV